MPNPKLETYKNKKTGDVYDYTDANAQGKLTAILNGTNIDSFGAVETALDDKVNVVAGKGLSTNDYDNTAKGIVDNIQSNVIANTKLIKDTVGWSGKNKLPNNAVSKTANNATLTVNTDKTVTVTTSGSVSANTFLNMGFFTLKKGSYILSQGVATVNDGCRIQLADESTTVVAYIQSGDADHIGFTLNEDKVVEGVIRIPSGWNTASITFKPMITDVNCLDQSYEPYHESVEDWYWNNNAKTGVHNFLNTEKFETGTRDGVTATLRADKGISLTGTPTLQAGTTAFRNYGTVLKAGIYKYKLNKNPKGTCVIGVNDSASGLGNYKILAELTTNMTEISFTVTDEDLASKPYVFCELGVYYNAGNIDEVYYPQILLEEDTFDGFLPFTMTNEQLTDAVTPKKLEETSTSEQVARITVPTSFHIAYAFVSIDSDKTFQCVIAKGISSRAFRFTYKASSNTEVRGYIWYDYTNSRIEVGSFMVNDVEMKNDTNIKLEVFYI